MLVGEKLCQVPTMSTNFASIPAPGASLRSYVDNVFRRLSGTPRPARGRPALAPKRHLPEFHAAAVEGISILLVGRPSGILTDMASWLRGNGANVIWLPPGLNQIKALAGKTAPTASVAIVDLDVLGDIKDVLEHLLILRRSRPELAVILVSRGFHADDVSIERLPISDCSLKVPVSFASLDFALYEAVEVNNPVWQQSAREARFAHG